MLNIHRLLPLWRPQRKRVQEDSRIAREGRQPFEPRHRESLVDGPALREDCHQRPISQYGYSIIDLKYSLKSYLVFQQACIWSVEVVHLASHFPLVPLPFADQAKPAFILRGAGRMPAGIRLNPADGYGWFQQGVQGRVHQRLPSPKLVLLNCFVSSAHH